MEGGPPSTKLQPCSAMHVRDISLWPVVYMWSKNVQTDMDEAGIDQP